MSAARHLLNPINQTDTFTRLTTVETKWAERHEFFQSRGYLLRPRLLPGWVPSWKRDPSIHPLNAPDHLSLPLGQTRCMDFTRVSDGKLVLMKRVQTDSQELRIASYFSSDTLRADPRNHCVPLLDAFPDPQDPSLTYMVMPFLRYINNPAFETIGTILDCVHQLLEGLVFMHEHNVAHRDCAYKNVMMDAEGMYPEGFHPISQRARPDNLRESAPFVPRTQAPPKYYFLDFGLSTHFSEHDTDRLVTGTDGLDQDAPELSDEVPYDPFKLDVFILGNLLRQVFTERYANVDMLSPLLSRMTQRDPAHRPSAAEALRHYRQIESEVWMVQRLWRARPRGESIILRPLLDVLSLLVM